MGLQTNMAELNPRTTRQTPGEGILCLLLPAMNNPSLLGTACAGAAPLFFKGPKADTSLYGCSLTTKQSQAPM